MQSKPIGVQQSLFPETITLTAAKAEMLNDLKPELQSLGYELESIDATHFAVNGTPDGETEDNLQDVIDSFLESYRTNIFLHHSGKNENAAMSLAKQKCHRFTFLNSTLEIKGFLRQLMECQIQNVSPSGKKIIHQWAPTDLLSLFDK